MRYTCRYMLTCFLIAATCCTAMAQDDDADPPRPKALQPQQIGCLGQQLSKPFRPVDALTKLFPATPYKTDERDNDSLLMVWACKSCKPKGIAGELFVYEGMDKGEFPRGKYMTQVGDTLHYTDDSGRRNIFFSFASLDIDYASIMHCGRLQGAYMGLARFTEVGNKWVLTMFNVCVGSYGMFRHLPHMRLIKLGKGNYGVYVLNSTGAGGGVLYSDLVVFAMLNNDFRQVMSVDGVARSNTRLSEWDMQLAPCTTHSPARFAPLRLTLAGDLARDSFRPDSDDTLSNVPTELRKTIAAKDSFQFTLQRQYRFSKGKYRLGKSEVRLR